MHKSKGKTILLVEDEPLIVMAEKMQLEKCGYAVQVVSTGEQAVEAVETSSKIDLVLMDINLGDGIDGTEAAQIILEKHDIPIIFLSSHTEPEIVEKTENITSYGYVVKNSSITVLDASIKMAFKLFLAKKKEIEKETALALAEEKYRLISENTSDGIVHFSKDGVIDYVSPSYLKQLGYSVLKEFGKGRTAIDSEIHPEDRDSLFAAIHGSIERKEGELTYIFRVRRSDGHYIWREDHTNFMYDRDGTYLGSYVSCRDITERKMMEAELLQSEGRFKKIVQDHSTLAVQGYGNDGITKYWNKASERLYGYTAQEAIGKNLLDLIIPEEMKHEVARAVKQMVETGIVTPEAELSLVRKDGTRVHVLSSHAIVQSPNHLPELFCLDIDISERLKIEEALRESKQKAEMLLNVAAEIIISLDSNGSITLLNDSGHRILGYEPPELVGKNWFDTCLPVENREEIRKYFRLLVDEESNSLFSHEDEVVLKNGKRRTILWHNSILRDKDGKGIGLFSSGEDSTERKKIEKALHEGEAQKNMILNGLSANIALLDGNLNILWANKAAADSVNQTVEKLIGSHCYSFWGDDASPCVDCPSVRAIKSGTSVHQIVKTKDGKFWDIRGDPIFDDDGTVISIVEIAQDITKLKNQEEALRNSAKRLEGIIEGTHAGTWEWNVQTGETVFNSVWAEIIGYSLEELAPVSIQTWIALVHPEDAAKSHELLRQHFSGNTPFYELECRMKHKDGHWVWVLDRGKVITWAEDGKPLQMFGTHTDIDEQKNASDKIKKLLAEKELVLKEVHHRIKNNMNAISSLLSLQTGAVNDPAAIVALQDAINRIKSMSLLYDKLYQAPAYSELSVKVYLSSLVDEVVANFPNSQCVKIKKDFNDFMLDVKRLQPLGIIMNELLTNSMKYAFSGKEQGRISVSSTCVENHLTVSVQDDGIGIPELVSFENSSGFGLQLVATLAQQLNGTIRMERDSGTKYVLEFDA